MMGGKLPNFHTFKTEVTNPRCSGASLSISGSKELEMRPWPKCHMVTSAPSQESWGFAAFPVLSMGLTLQPGRARS